MPAGSPVTDPWADPFHNCAPASARLSPCLPPAPSQSASAPALSAIHNPARIATRSVAGAVIIHPFPVRPSWLPGWFPLMAGPFILHAFNLLLGLTWINLDFA